MALTPQSELSFSPSWELLSRSTDATRNMGLDCFFSPVTKGVCHWIRTFFKETQYICSSLHAQC